MNRWTSADIDPPKDGYYLAYVRYRTFLDTVLWTQDAVLWTASHGWNVTQHHKVKAWMPLPEDPDPALVPRE